MNSNLIKVMAIFVFFGFAECAAGSCLNYGHACWGAHGKRSRPDDPAKFPDWFLSRLVRNPEEPSENPGSFQRERMDDWNQLADDPIFDGQYERIRLPNRLDKRSPPHN